MAKRTAWNSTLPAPTKALGRKTPLRVKGPETKRRARFKRSFHSKARVLWIQMRPSVVSGRMPCENAHVRSRGAGGTYRDIVPLTRDEHRELHTIGRDSFEAKYDVDLETEAAITQHAWENR